VSKKTGSIQFRQLKPPSRPGSSLDRVEHRKELVITRDGKSAARLVPNTGGIDRAQASAAAERIRARAAKLKAVFDWDALKSERDAGRP